MDEDIVRKSGKPLFIQSRFPKLFNKYFFVLYFVKKYPFWFFRIIRLIYSNGELLGIDELSFDLEIKPLYWSSGCSAGSLENKDIAAKIEFEHQCELYMRLLGGITNTRVTFSELGYYSSNVSNWPVRNRIIAILGTNRIGNMPISPSILDQIRYAPHC